jgi:hypothetical protein
MTDEQTIIGNEDIDPAVEICSTNTSSKICWKYTWNESEGVYRLDQVDENGNFLFDDGGNLVFIQ